MKAQLVEGVRGIGHQFAQEDFFIAVKRRDNELEDFGEGEAIEHHRRLERELKG